MSGISGVGYGGYIAKPNFCGTGEKKESHAVRNGALIGAGVGAVGQSFLIRKTLKFFNIKSISYFGAAGIIAITAALTGLIGAGIGKACTGSAEQMTGK